MRRRATRKMAAMRIVDAPTTTLVDCNCEGWGGNHVCNSPMMAGSGSLMVRVWNLWMRNFEERRKPYLVVVEGDRLLAKPVPVGRLPSGLPGVNDGDVVSMHVSFIEVPKSTIAEKYPKLPSTEFAGTE